MATWYRNGTVTVTSGSKNVAGVDTLWTSQASVGDVFTIDGTKIYEIESIADNTHLTLKTAYSGSTASGAAYSIVRNFTSTTNAGLAAKISALLVDWQNREDELLAWQSGSALGGYRSNGTVASPVNNDPQAGYYPLTNALGIKQYVACPAKLLSGAVGSNTDTIDGFHASQTPAANQIPVFNSAGRLVLDGTDDGSSKIQTSGTIRANRYHGSGQFDNFSMRASGKAVQVGCASSIGYIYSYDQDAKGYLPLHIRGNNMMFSGGRILAGPTLPIDDELSAFQVNGKVAATNGFLVNKSSSSTSNAEGLCTSSDKSTMTIYSFASGAGESWSGKSGIYLSTSKNDCSFNIWQGPANRFNVYSGTGEVLINTTSLIDASAKLQVNGTIYSTSLVMPNLSISPSSIGPTSDGSDNSFYMVRGGGSGASARGSFIACYGNEHVTNPGNLTILSGIGDVNIYTGSSGSLRSKILSTGEVLIAQSNSIGTDYKLQVGGPIYAQGLKLDGTTSSDVNTLDYYKEGTFTATGTGFSGTAPTGTATYVRVGKQVTIVLPTLYGTSNATTFTLTGVPSEIVPPSNVNSFPIRINDNGSALTWGCAFPKSDGIFDIRKDPNGSAFTASGTKGIGGGTFVYYLI